VRREEKTLSEKRQRTVVFINKTKGSTKKRETQEVPIVTHRDISRFYVVDGYYGFNKT
jgi:hypothetical protein